MHDLQKIKTWCCRVSNPTYLQAHVGRVANPSTQTMKGFRGRKHIIDAWYRQDEPMHDLQKIKTWRCRVSNPTYKPM